MDDGDPIPSDHKLCGFLCTVLAFTSPNPTPPPLNSRCYLISDGPNTHFKSLNDAVLTPITPNSNTNTPNSSIKTQNSNVETTSYSGSRKRGKRRIGMVNGSISVVQQLHVLVKAKCLRIDARVVRVCVGNGDDEVRIVVLVDVYLPIALWSGWQFPRSGSTAAALFGHLSDDWGARSSMLEFGKSNYQDNDSIWNLSDCHVLGCKQHCISPDASKKRLFELHEIFKSLPGVVKKVDPVFSRVNPGDASCASGIWMVSDDVLLNILSALGPIDLVRLSATCHHLRVLAATIMPCMKLKLFPHQRTAVDWMLQRERDTDILPHPLYTNFVTEDGFSFYVNSVSGEIVTGLAPMIQDFHGGMFCDEPGLGKTITALSLILKTQGTVAEPPDGAQVIWCTHNAGQRCGYYELRSDTITGSKVSSNGPASQNARRGQLSLDKVTPKKTSLLKGTRFEDSAEQIAGSNDSHPGRVIKSAATACSTPATFVVRTRSCSRIKRNLLNTYKGSWESTKKRKRIAHRSPLDKRHGLSNGFAWHEKATSDEYNETWVQCDACRKWRRLADGSVADTTTAWFCSMNSDHLHQSCSVREESWDYPQSVTYFPGFHTKGTSGGREENVSFFTGVLKEHFTLMNYETKKALTWLAKLSPEKLSEMETNGLVHPVTETRVLGPGEIPDFHKIFQAFGIIKRMDKGTTRWYYPRTLVNLVFDLDALRIALCAPLDSFRLYLSRATLIVVPSTLVDHWRTQIEKHVRPGQLRLFVWTDHKKPCPHNLAWDYDVVITTFNRLSAEWSPRNRSVLMQVHWLRVVLDEGHTLGSSLNLTNKLQMAVSLTASNRWLLTGTPAPNTPNSQVSQLQPMLKFLREEAYGQNQKAWETGIFRPFEAEMEEGRFRLLRLLHRCMISARKADLHNIPPCIKKVRFLNFTEEHAKSYNELVVTVRRNILMADWNDPSHVESLLNPKQWKFRSTTIRNVRLSCCVAGHIKVMEAGQDIKDTMDMLAEDGLDPNSEEFALIKYSLLCGGNCMRCEEWCRLPAITPCRHLLCLDCVALDSERCTFPGCGNLYEMQSPEILTRPENPNPKWPVPKDLIELQPSYKQDDWHPDWQSTSSSKVNYLVHRLKELHEANRMIGYTMDVDNDTKSIIGPYFSSENSHCSSFLSQQSCAKCTSESHNKPPEKVLIFSQFLEHIHVIEQQLMLAGIRFTQMYSPMHSSNKMKSLATFQHDANCMALLMDGSAALGLDLSFVTHVFLMEPIWDKSMEEQVISRAHRMGATRPIHVETLAMRGTIEEQMLKFLQDAEDCRRFLKDEFVKHDQEGSRAHRTLHDFAESSYLAQLSFVRTNAKT